MLRDLKIKSGYSSSSDNILKDFYNPTLKEAKTYDRISGFFSPKVLAVASRGFSELIKNGGKVRIITSVKVNEETYNSLKEMSNPDTVNTILDGCLNDTLESQLEKDYLSVFAYLLRYGQLQLKIAFPEDRVGIMHEKIGIVDDGSNAISFSGSNNETAYGWTRNTEQFMVFRNWDSIGKEYYQINLDHFEKLWSNTEDGVVVLIPDNAIKQKIIKISNIDNEDINEIVRRIKEQENGDTPRTSPKQSVDLRNYQKDAIQSWIDHNYRGIFEMATGTGKTFTGLYAAKKLFKEEEKLFLVISVPLKHLISQWQLDIEKVFPGTQMIQVSSDFPDWRDKLPKAARAFSKGWINQVVVITTYASFSSDDFRKILEVYDSRYTLLADEVHNARTDKILGQINLFQNRLGLSATPKNEYSDNEGADVMIETFGGIIYRYSLAEAIQNKYLVQYEYHPIFVYLNEDEVKEYIEYSIKISWMMNADDTDRNNDMLTAILNKRSMVVKNAENKKGVIANLIDQLYKNNEYRRMLIYCDSTEQIDDTQRILSEHHISSSRITYKEDMFSRRTRLSDFAIGTIDTLVARKCLDEGVDIPSTRRAILIASNTDQREYIQRLGRILRKYEGKNKATVYDLITLPPDSDNAERYRYLLRSELRRMDFFAQNTLNKSETTEVLDSLKMKYNYRDEESVDEEN